jgi:hypothetical protein
MIYNIPTEYRKLNAILESEGEDSEGLQEAIQEAFQDLMQDMANGAEVSAKIIRSAEIINFATQHEIDRLSAIVKCRKLRIENAKNGVKCAMIATDTNRIETTLGSFSLRKGSERTEIIDIEALVNLSVENDLIADAVKIEVVKKPVAKEVKRLIKEGLITEDIAKIVVGEKTISLK